jgi:hypothetical protein
MYLTTLLNIMMKMHWEARLLQLCKKNQDFTELKLSLP